MASLARLAAVAAMCWFGLAGCGGGGSGGASDDGNPGSGGPGSNGGGTTVPEPEIFVDSSTLEATGSWGDYRPSRIVQLTAAYIPDEGIYVGHALEGEGVANVQLAVQSSYRADLHVAFTTPLDLPEGTYHATITVVGCYDEQCAKQVKGSPLAIPVTYTVTSSEVTLLTSSIAVAAATGQTEPVQAIAQVAVSRPPQGSLKYEIARSTGNTFAQSVTTLTGGGSPVSLRFQMRTPTEHEVGTHNEIVPVRVCYDPSCSREVRGSPLSVALQYTATRETAAEPGVPPLPATARETLSHDVVDAEYVRRLDAIVMVSTYPANALHFYDVAQGIEHHVPLDMAPTAVSVSPDGRFAAVGHDARITHVDLDSIVAGTPVTKRLDVSTRVSDLVLDDRGYVHVLSDVQRGARSVAVATNVETAGDATLHERSRARLHPSGDYLYAATTAVSPDDIIKHDVRGGDVKLMYDSPYHGDYQMCGNAWFEEDGASIYTACGNTFRASTTQAQDMTYAGRLPLTASWYGPYRIQSLSQSGAVREVALLEQGMSECSASSSAASCYSHLAVFASDTLARTAVYSLAPVTVESGTFPQRGMFVFHRSDGLRRYVISQLHGPYPWPRPHYLTVVE
jgi:hypothetical protein